MGRYLNSEHETELTTAPNCLEPVSRFMDSQLLYGQIGTYGKAEGFGEEKEMRREEELVRNTIQNWLKNTA